MMPASNIKEQGMRDSIAMQREAQIRPVGGVKEGELSYLRVRSKT